MTSASDYQTPAVLLSLEMTTEHILGLLIEERDRLNRAIAALGEPGSAAAVKRAVHPAAAVKAAGNPTGQRRKRTAAEKRAQSLRMKAFWAKRRKEAAK